MSQETKRIHPMIDDHSADYVKHLSDVVRDASELRFHDFDELQDAANVLWDFALALEGWELVDEDGKRHLANVTRD